MPQQHTQTGTSDSVRIDAINYGRTVVHHPQSRNSYATGCLVHASRQPAIDMATVRAAMSGAYVQSPIDGKYFKAFVRTEETDVLERETGRLAACTDPGVLQVKERPFRARYSRGRLHACSPC